MVDTGINPYHREFRDRTTRAYEHPSTYIPGYPKKAKALRLSLKEAPFGEHEPSCGRDRMGCG